MLQLVPFQTKLTNAVNEKDLKWIGSEQNWIRSRKLDFLLTPTKNLTYHHKTRVFSILFPAYNSTLHKHIMKKFTLAQSTHSPPLFPPIIPSIYNKYLEPTCKTFITFQPINSNHFPFSLSSISNHSPFLFSPSSSNTHPFFFIFQHGGWYDGQATTKLEESRCCAYTIH